MDFSDVRRMEMAAGETHRECVSFFSKATKRPRGVLARTGQEEDDNAHRLGLLSNK